MAVLFGVCNWVHPLLQSPSCCKELKEAGIDAIQLDLGSAEEDFPLSSPGIQRQWKEEAELYGIRLDAVAVLAVLKHGMTAEPGSERRNTAEKAIAAAVDCAADMGIPRIVLPSFKASAIRNKDDLRETARCLRLACALAKHRGIAVATENLLDVTMMKSLSPTTTSVPASTCLILSCVGGKTCLRHCRNTSPCVAACISRTACTANPASGLSVRGHAARVSCSRL